MRPLLGLFVVLALSVPATALPCSISIQYGPHAPDDRQLVPGNAQLFVQAWWFAGWPMTAELIDPTATVPIPLNVDPLGSDAVRLRLPELSPNLSYEVRLELDDGSMTYSAQLASDGADDLSPPAIPPRLDLTATQPNDTCTGPEAWVLRADFDAATDDRGIAAYVLYDVTELDVQEVRGAQVAPTMVSPLRADLGNVTGNRCFYVAAFDFAGNSAVTDISCIDIGGAEPPPPPPRTDAGAPPPQPMDAGAPVDGGTPPNDGGTRAPSGRLDRADPTCGCTTSDGSASLFGLILLAFGAFVRRK